MFFTCCVEWRGEHVEAILQKEMYFFSGFATRVLGKEKSLVMVYIDFYNFFCDIFVYRMKKYRLKDGIV